LYLGNLCEVDPNIKILNLDLLSFDCKTYPYAWQGMQLIFTRQIELLKENLKAYVSSSNTTSIVNSPVMQELYALQFVFI